MSILKIKVYELFKQRFNEDKARIVLEYIDTKTDEKISQKKDISDKR